MGACNGYRYHDLSKGNRHSLKPRAATFKDIIVVPAYPEREADEKMLAEIAAKPEDREMY